MLDNLFNGLREGYFLNERFNQAYTNDVTSSIIEYLLTVTTAQNLLDYKNGAYVINLEYDADLFFKNAFFPYKEIGDGLFNNKTISRPIVKGPTRPGRIDIGLTLADQTYYSHFASKHGIELKGINPTTELVIEDIDRLVESMENQLQDFENSIESCYSIFVKKLGGNVRLSKADSLMKAKNKFITELTSEISQKINFNSTHFEIFDKVFTIKSTNDYSDLSEEDLQELDSSEVGRDTKIIFGVVVKIFRK
ncbi:hypothetical protein [Rufibacter quisquiliarum]|uniref:Uncharacterized protein n=1 Tax=Rufibacter quisquiliarum TaxID=1549639 RepID=A0A839H1X8_9BACT|nr:hypothetical protein [Rufibacter quisquiliarum]MBA9079891.1 hypothetical protein [Rufibacter quisquiliarum]